MNPLYKAGDMYIKSTQMQSRQIRQGKQGGLVLFFALIALVVMSLAAVALVRSVDTNTVIAGNLVFKQLATTSADGGLENAISWIKNNAASKEIDSAGNGYYAILAENVLPLGSTTAKTRFNTGYSLATGTGITAGKDSSGNTISYVIERMCRIPGPKDTAGCLFGITEVGGSNSVLPNPPPVTYETSPMYRVTVRVNGPKNTISYTQAFIY